MGSGLEVFIIFSCLSGRGGPGGRNESFLRLLWIFCGVLLYIYVCYRDLFNNFTCNHSLFQATAGFGVTNLLYMSLQVCDSAKALIEDTVYVNDFDDRIMVHEATFFQPIVLDTDISPRPVCINNQFIA
jgi:hypothetical protein